LSFHQDVTLAFARGFEIGRIKPTISTGRLPAKPALISSLV